MLYMKRNDTQPKTQRNLRQERHWGRRLLLSLSLGVLCSLGALLFSPIPAVHAQSIDEGLVGYWPFDEGSGATSADRSGNGNTATLSPGASFTTAVAPIGLNNSAALSFRGGGQATATSNGLANRQQLTIAAWVRQTDYEGVQRYVTLGDENAVLRHDAGLHFYVKLNGRLVGERLTTAIPLGGYHHVAGTYDGAMLRVYLDGNLVSSEVVSGTLDSGSGLRFSSSAEPLHGELDEVRIYNRALTASAIRGLTFNCAAVSEIPPIECQALVALYASTDGDQWRDNQNWLRTNTPCRWLGISCRLGRVTEFFSDGNQMRGVLPPEVGNLTKLRQIIIHDSQLRGTIPPELGNLIDLERVWLYNNQLSGAIPPELGNLTNLQVLDLTVNQLSGAIPPELGNLTNLQILWLDTNRLSGVIPPELGNLINLEILSLDANQLSGAIPPELGNLTNLRYLGLVNNQLDDSIPATLCNLSLTDGADWGYNKLLASAPCLANQDPDWMTTQTVPPTAIQAQPLVDQQIQVTWTPISYTADGGYYTVLAGVTAGGPYTVVAQTADKTATGITLAPLGLDAYYLLVRTVTPQHGRQQNDLTSQDSAAILVLIGEKLTVTQDSALPIHLNANAGDHNRLTYSLMSLPTHGSLSGVLPHVRYTPEAGFTGEDSFTFKANDGKVDSNLATITLRVVAASPGNRPPVAQEDAFTVTRNSQANLLAVLTNDQDADGDALFLVAVDSPLNGTAQIVNGQLHYAPATDFVGVDHFTYTVSDGKESKVATVSVTVTASVGGTTSQAIYLPLIQR